MKISTEITLTFTDTVTGITRIADHKNTNVESRTLCSRATFPLQLGVGNRAYVTGSYVLGKIHAHRKYSVYLSTEQEEFTNFASDLWWKQVRCRFNSTGSSEDIHTVILSDTVNNNASCKPYGYVVITPAAVQGPNEVLDITYRVIFELDVSSYQSRIASLWFITGSVAAGQLGDAVSKLALSTCWDGPTLSDWGFLIHRILFSTNTAYITYLYGFTSLSYLTIDDGIGMPLRRGCGEGATTRKIEYNTTGDYLPTQDTFMSPTRNTYPNYPVGSLINHSVGATIWYEDLSNLATGLGQPTVAMPTPTYSNVLCSDMHTIAITKSGNTGTAEYILRLTNVAGITLGKGLGYDYIDIPTRYLNADNAVPPHVSMSTTDNNPLMHTGFLYAFRYNSDVLVSTDMDVTFGFGIHDIPNHKYIHHDADTTPPFPITVSHEVYGYEMCRDDAGSIYVGLRDAGVAKLTDPFGTPVWSVVNLATIGAPSDIISMCHGYQDRIWAITATNVCYTDDNGATWTSLANYSFSGAANAFVIAGRAATVTSSATSHELAISFYGTVAKDITAVIYGAWYDPVANNVIRITSHDSTSLDTFYSLQYIHELDTWCTTTSSATSTRKLGYARWGTGSAEWMAVRPPATYATAELSYTANTLAVTDLLGNAILTMAPYVGENWDLCMFMPDGSRVGSIMAKYEYNTPHANEYDIADGIEYDGAFGRCTFSSKKDNNNANVTPLHIHEGNNTYSVDNTAHRNGGVEGNYLDEECVLNGSVYRWDGSAWVANYNAVAVATADGSSTVGATRVNFNTNSNYFHNRCYLDVTPAMTGIAYSTGGITIAATYTPVAKITNPNTSDYTDSRYSHLEEYATTCCELSDTTNTHSVAVQYNNLSGDLVLVVAVDSVVTTTVLVSSPVFEESRIALTISPSGTTVKVYKNGSQIGATVTLSSALILTNTGDSLRLTVGCLNWAPHISKPFTYNLFKGDITNIQIWNDVWDTTDVSNDHGDHAGLIVSAANLTVRYLLTTANYGEGRATTAATVTGLNQMQHTFPDGDLTSNSYVKGDWYTCAVLKDGILKDNITSFDYSNSLHVTLLNTNGIVTNNAGTTTIPNTTATITEPGRPVTITSNVKVSKGQIGLNSTSVRCKLAQFGVGTNEVEFVMVHGYDRTTVSLTLGGGTVRDTYVEFIEQCTPTGTVKILGKGNTAQTNVPCDHAAGDKFKLTYSTVTFEFKVFRWNGSAYVQIGTTEVVTDTGTDLTWQFSNLNNACLSSAYGAFKDIMVTYTPPASLMYFGDKTLKTGAWRHDFMALADGVYGDEIIYIDGVEATVIRESGYSERYQNAVNSVAPGTVVICPASGACLFDPADATKTITSNDLLYLHSNNPAPI